jgi:hypothetical protein
MAMGLPVDMSAGNAHILYSFGNMWTSQRNFWDASVILSGIKHEWYVSVYEWYIGAWTLHIVYL